MIAAAALMMAGFVSCKKDYTCQCTWDLAGSQTTVDLEMNNVSKKDAKDACEAATATYSQYTGVSCELK